MASGRLPWAVWKPLGPETEPQITPTVLIFHTMVGGLLGTDSYFRQQGYTGDESTFGLGGPTDPNLDGVLWQWQDMNFQADAQYAGNAYADSVETSDGGHPTHPWSSKQLDSLVRLTVDWCRMHGIEPNLVPTTGNPGKGLGYHQLRHDWNLDGHVCPGPVREGQLRQIVIPKARAALQGAPYTPPKPVPAAPVPHQPSTHLVVDGILGSATISAMQHVLASHGTYKGSIDGIMGPGTRVGLQVYLKVAHDGVVGPVTVRALQHHVGAVVDGAWGRDTTIHLQETLNAGRF